MKLRKILTTGLTALVLLASPVIGSADSVQGTQFTQLPDQPTTVQAKKTRGPHIHINMTEHMHYYRQGHTSCCESASLLMALQIKGKAKRLSLWHFTKGWVHYSTSKHHMNPNRMYSHGPFKRPATLYPRAEKRVANDFHVRSKIIDYARRNQIINYLKHGDPIVMEAGHRMHARAGKYVYDHTIAIVGYIHNSHGEYVKYADPNCVSRRSGIGWGKLSTLMQSYHRPAITGERALVLF